MTIHKALHKIQVDLKAPKGQRNKFGNYNYRSSEDILEAIKIILPEAFSLILQDEIINIGDRFYIKATALFSDGSESLSCSAFAREPEAKKGMDESQITGCASSYARKYALNGLFCIDDTKDADATNKHETIPIAQLNKLLESIKADLSSCEDMESLGLLTSSDKFLQDRQSIKDNSAPKFSEIKKHYLQIKKSFEVKI